MFSTNRKNFSAIFGAWEAQARKSLFMFCARCDISLCGATFSDTPQCVRLDMSMRSRSAPFRASLFGASAPEVPQHVHSVSRAISLFGPSRAMQCSDTLRCVRVDMSTHSRAARFRASFLEPQPREVPQHVHSVSWADRSFIARVVRCITFF